MKSSRIKKIIFILVVMLFQIKYVNAASYDLVLETDNTNVNKNSDIVINVVLKNISGITNGLNACKTTISTTEGATINSISGVNSWSATNGASLVLDSNNNITADTVIATINATITGNSNITLYYTNCSDGEIEYTALDNTIKLTVCENAETNEEVIENETTIETNTNVESSTTVENPQTGVYSILIYMIIIIAFTLLIVKLNNKYNLFRRKM